MGQLLRTTALSILAIPANRDPGASMGETTDVLLRGWWDSCDHWDWVHSMLGDSAGTEKATVGASIPFADSVIA